MSTRVAMVSQEMVMHADEDNDTGDGGNCDDMVASIVVIMIL